MKCSGCTSVNVCRFVAEMKSTEEKVKSIVVDGLPFSVTISCKFFNEDIRTRTFKGLLGNAQSSYCREDIPIV